MVTTQSPLGDLEAGTLMQSSENLKKCTQSEPLVVYIIAQLHQFCKAYSRNSVKPAKQLINFLCNLLPFFFLQLVQNFAWIP